MDTAVASVSIDKIGVASGIFKMSSSLGFSFGIAISAAVYGAVIATGNIAAAAPLGILVNVIFAIPALIPIMVTISDNEGKNAPELSAEKDETEKTLVLTVDPEHMKMDMR